MKRVSPLQRVVQHREGCLQIIACAGSGKTESISRRIAHMIADGVTPSSIVAFTFNEKAAEELRSRTRRRLEEIAPKSTNTGDMFVGTIHSFCWTLLQNYKPLYVTYDVVDENQQVALIQRNYFKLHLKALEGSYYGFYRVIGDFVRAANMAREERISIDAIASVNPDLAEALERYYALLHERRLLDFSGIMAATISLLEDDPDVLARVRADIRYVVADEYQDVNLLQERLIELICVKDANLCVVGDDDQTIYQWRGTDVSNMLSFAKRYRKVTSVKLETNRRSTDGVIELANGLSAGIPDRLTKVMKPVRAVRIRAGELGKTNFDTQAEEAKFIVGRIEQLLGTEFQDRDGPRGLELRDFAVLYRSLRYARPLIQEFAKRRTEGIHLDYNVVGIAGLLDRPEIVALMRVLAYLCDENDRSLSDDSSWYGYKPTWNDVSAAIRGPFNVSGSRLTRFHRRLDRIRNSFYDGRRHSLQQVYSDVLEALNARALHSKNGENEGLFYNLAQFSKAVSDFETIYHRVRPNEAKYFVRFMWNHGQNQYSEGGLDDPSRVNAINILTVHRAKGLEWPVVFVPTLSNGIFPSSMAGRKGNWLLDRSLFPATRYEGSLADEQRLFYVAVTRSKRYLYLTHAYEIEGRKRRVNPSSFYYDASSNHMAEGGIVKHPLKLPKAKSTSIARQAELNLSFTELSAFLRCGWDFKFRHIFGFQPGLAEELGYGEAVHAVLTALHSQWLDGKPVPDEELERLTKEQFFLPFANDESTERLRKAAFEQIRDYRDKKEAASSNVRATEKQFEYTHAGAVIAGKIDLLEDLTRPGQVKVVDFKTAHTDTITPEHRVQLGVYTDATKQSLALTPVEAAIYSLPEKKELVAKADGNLIRTARRAIAKATQEMRTREFTYQPNPTMCPRCDFRTICAKRHDDSRRKKVG